MNEQKNIYLQKRSVEYAEVVCPFCRAVNRIPPSSYFHTNINEPLYLICTECEEEFCSSAVFLSSVSKQKLMEDLLKMTEVIKGG